MIPNPTATTATPVPASNSPSTTNPLLADVLSVLPASVVKFCANIVSVGHKEAAFVMGVLAAFGVVPTVNKTTDQLGAVLLLGYSAITHAANALGTARAS